MLTPQNLAIAPTQVLQHTATIADTSVDHAMLGRFLCLEALLLDAKESPA